MGAAEILRKLLLAIEWIAAHSPRAEGRVERGFGTAQDRLVKGLRVAGASTLEEANAYLESEFLPWWNQTLTVTPVSFDDADRLLGKEHSLAAILSHVETRQVANDYTIRFENAGSFPALSGTNCKTCWMRGRKQAYHFRLSIICGGT